MTFAKLAADQILDPVAEADRQAKRQRWMHLLATLGVAGATGGAAYYAMKNHGEHWNNAMRASGLTQPDPQPTRLQSLVDKSVGRIFPGHHSAEALAGAAGGVAGYNALGAGNNRSLADQAANASQADSQTAKNFQKLDSENIKPGSVQTILGDGGRAVPTNPNDASITQRMAALGRNGEVQPLNTGSAWNPMNGFKGLRDQRAVLRGAKILAKSGPGVATGPAGSVLDHDALRQALSSATATPAVPGKPGTLPTAPQGGMSPERFRTFVRGNVGHAVPYSRLARLGVGGIGAWAGAAGEGALESALGSPAAPTAIPGNPDPTQVP